MAFGVGDESTDDDVAILAGNGDFGIRDGGALRIENQSKNCCVYVLGG